MQKMVSFGQKMIISEKMSQNIENGCNILLTSSDFAKHRDAESRCMTPL